jgi:murein DD-endopeptidase MepM/ murein hydrolase activator NlpD/muramidase (phage lysozyme)
MANPSVLTPIGYDTPQLQYAVTPQVAQALQPDSTPDTTGLNILSEANKSFQAANQAQTQSYQIQADALNNIQKAQVASATAIGQAQSVNFQATAASGAANARAWAGAAETIGNVVDKFTKEAERKRLADLKAELDRNQITTTTELENLQIDWIEKGRLNKEGTSAYRRAVSDVLARRPLESDTITSLTTKYYSPALEHAKTQDKLVYETAQKTASYNRDIKAKQLKIDLTVATAGLEENAPYLGEEGQKPYVDTINTKIQAVFDNPELDELTKLHIVSEALDPVLKSTNIWSATKASLGRIQSGSAAVANFITANGPRVLDGSLAQSTFNEEANQIRRAYGLPVKESTPADTDLQRTVSNLETRQKLDSLNRQAVISDAEKMEGNKLYTRSIGLQLYLSPELREVMKKRPKELLDANALAGVELAEKADHFFGKETEAYNTKVAAANEAILKIQQQDYKTAISLINKAGEDNTANSLASQLRGLGLGMPVAPPGQVGVTQEQLDFMQSNSVAVQDAIRKSLEPATRLHYDRTKEFSQMGFFADRKESQKYLKSLEPVTESYNKRIEDARLRRITQLTPPSAQQPGQSPNFNGGSLGVQAPLMRRSFRGVANVTMPFPVGDAKAMEDRGGPDSGGYFGDYRPRGRKHQGVDFPVPTGTPILSLVYGTVSEIKRDPKDGGLHYGNAVAVKGDDGKEYFFAHLDRTSVALGQRVGPGEKLGLSGETGAPGAPHLHMEVYVDGKPVDPLQVLSTGTFGQQPKMPRSSGPLKGVPQGEMQVDPRAIPVGGGHFLIDGQLQKFAPDYSESQALKQGMTDIKGLQKWSPSPDVHDIKIAPGLEVVGYRALPIDTSVKPGQPVGYYTLRNTNGDVLIQTAYQKKGGKKMLQDFGFDGKGYTPPRQEQPTPATVNPPTVDKSRAGRVLMQATGQKDEAGLDIIAVTLYDSSGKLAGSYNVNSGRPSMQAADRNVAGNGAPLPFGSYSIGAPEAADDIPGMRSDFIPITPLFKTNRSLLGIHFDGDRSTDPGSLGCIVFKSKAEFDTFKQSLSQSAITRLDFSKAGGVRVVTPPIQTQAEVPQSVRANAEGQRLARLLSNPNVSAFLDAISNAEGNPKFDEGFGYRKISSLSEHPYNGRELTPEGRSSASGAYQFMGHTWGDMKRALGLQDFSPVSQKIAALKQLDQAGVLNKVINGQVDDDVLSRIAPIWASVERSAGSSRSVHSGNQVSAGGTYSGFKNFYNQRRSAPPTQHSQPQSDPGKIPIGGGKFLLRGKIVGANYTPLQPLEHSYASASKHDYGEGEGSEDSYGYSQLQRQPDLIASVNAIAKKADVPPQWIADIAALKGTAGIDIEELQEIEEQLKERSVQTPTELVALILGDGEKVKDLGVHAGRRYDSQFSRFDRTTALTHNRIFASCRLCQGLQAQSQFIPHKAEVA